MPPDDVTFAVLGEVRSGERLGGARHFDETMSGHIAVLLFDAKLTDGINAYRACRLPWDPRTR